MKSILFVLYLIFVTVWGRPQIPNSSTNEVYAPMPYDYQYKVEDAPTNNYFGANESGDVAGKVIGSYYVLLPDGRLMTVEYTVDGESGFVPKISFQANANPFQG